MGGTWVAFGESDTYLRLGGNGSGGSNIIGVNNLPSHTHSIPSLSGSTNSTGAHEHILGDTSDFKNSILVAAGSSAYAITANNAGNVKAKSAGSHSHTVTTNASTTGATGSGQAFNPKYVQVYAWKRTA